MIKTIQSKLVGCADLPVGSESELDSWPAVKEALKTCFGEKFN